MTSMPVLRLLSDALLATTLGIALTSCTTTLTPSALPTPAAGGPSNASVSAIDLATGEQEGAVNVSVDGGESGVGVTFREITIKPGATTGIHCHYGQLIAAVKQGALTHYANIYPTGVHVYNTGDAIVEGAGYPHEGRNEGKADVILWVAYIIPEGRPLAETVLENCD